MLVATRRRQDDAAYAFPETINAVRFAVNLRNFAPTSKRPDEKPLEADGVWLVWVRIRLMGGVRPRKPTVEGKRTQVQNEPAPVRITQKFRDDIVVVRGDVGVFPSTHGGGTKAIPKARVPKSAR